MEEDEEAAREEDVTQEEEEEEEEDATAGALGLKEGMEVKVVKKLYNASPMTILEVIHTHGGGADPLLIVGHNPGLETTVSNIVGNIVPFPVGAVAQASIIPGEESRVLAIWRPDEILPR